MSDKFKDSLLQAHVTNDILNEASEYVESIALGFGISPSSIPTPTPFKVERLARAYTYMMTAQLKAMFAGKDGNTDDAFASKYKMYKKQLDELEDSMLASDFTGNSVIKKRTFPMSVRLYRR